MYLIYTSITVNTFVLVFALLLCCFVVQGIQPAPRLSGISHWPLRHDVLLCCCSEWRHWASAISVTWGEIVYVSNCVWKACARPSLFLMIIHGCYWVIRKCSSHVDPRLPGMTMTNTTTRSCWLHVVAAVVPAAIMWMQCPYCLSLLALALRCLHVSGLLACFSMYHKSSTQSLLLFPVSR